MGQPGIDDHDVHTTPNLTYLFEPFTDRSWISDVQTNV